MKIYLKRILSLFLFALLLSTAIAAAEQPYSVTAKAFTLVPDQTVDVPIKLETPINNVINASFSVTFDPEVLQIVKSAEQYQITGGEVFGSEFMMIAAGNNTTGYANYGGTAASGQALSAGVIYTIRFNVLKAADPKLTVTVVSMNSDKEPTEAVYPSLTQDIKINQPVFTDLPNTGDELPVILSIALISLAAVSVTIILKRRTRSR